MNAATTRNRVLVVEDDPDIRLLVVTRLKQAGYLVRGVGDGAAALELVAGTDELDLFVLDVGLPDVDGFDLLARLRELPGKGRTPVIFLSARVQEEDIERGRALGAQYLTKPFVAAALLAKVSACLAGASDGDDAW
jgi:DNA-binding response OmpR family regulator